jgi:A/G-specific adenine glycosylase
MNFSQQLVEWQRRHGRHHLPWQATRDPYRIWVSEIMLQQTQVGTVIPYYERFMGRFPDIARLAGASEEEVLTYWAGLGYYARGRNLHRAARLIMEKHGGVFPQDFNAIADLPGIGRSTAAAISAFAFGERRAILDGNVKRVLTRVFAVHGWPGDRNVEARLWQLSESLLPKDGIETYTQALMDLGATVCTRSKPKCEACPLAGDCLALKENRIGSLPGPRPKRMLPERTATLLIIRHGRDVLLRKRPAAGIWGGLWCLPESGDDFTAACLQLTGNTPASIRQLPAFTHSFTHFRLAIQPVVLALEERPRAVTEPGSIWMDIVDAIEAAIPKPVKSILETLRA